MRNRSEATSSGDCPASRRLVPKLQQQKGRTKNPPNFCPPRTSPPSARCRERGRSLRVSVHWSESNSRLDAPPCLPTSHWWRSISFFYITFFFFLFFHDRSEPTSGVSEGERREREKWMELERKKIQRNTTCPPPDSLSAML